MEKLLKYLVNNKNKRRRRKKRFPRRGRVYPNPRTLDYQYLPSMQSMGPGTTTKNFERFVSVPPNTNIRQNLTSLLGDDDFQSSCSAFRYVKIIGICITQNAINLTNQQDNFYVRIAWSENYEDQEDIEKDDCSKILPNIGRTRFMFKPPNAQITLTELKSKTINPRFFMATEHLLDQINESYKIPGSIELYNTTSIDRKVRVTLRLIFRGSKVVDRIAEAKRILRRYEKEKENKEEIKENKEENKENKIVNTDVGEKNKEEEEEIEYDDEEEELSKWSNLQ